MPWKFNPFTGTLDFWDRSSDTTEAESAKRLEFDAIANEEISALKIVRLIDEETIELADISGTESEARAVGIALSFAAIGQTTRVLMFGRLEDNFFNFPINAPLYLLDNGTITDDDTLIPSGQYRVQIGHSLGAGAIFIKIEETILT